MALGTLFEQTRVLIAQVLDSVPKSLIHHWDCPKGSLKIAFLNVVRWPDSVLIHRRKLRDTAVLLDKPYPACSFTLLVSVSQIIE